jgi:hypothetical protein
MLTKSFTLILLLLLINSTFFKEFYCKKDIRDYTEAELDKLYEQWVENDLEDDEKQPKSVPPIDINSLRENVCCWQNL